MTMRKSAAFTQCAARSTPAKRRSGVSGGTAPASGGVVVAAIGPSHPSVDVVAVVLPVPGLDLLRRFDRVEPLDRLVAVHRRDVEPHRAAVLGRDVATLHLVGDDDVLPA